MKKTVDQIIESAAQAAASEVVRQQRRGRNVNLYRAMERLLRSYPKLRKLAMNPEDYGFIPPERSKSITIAPPPGGGAQDHEEMIADAISDRIASYERTKARFDELNAVISQFEDRPEFTVIRMYYWNEDCIGNERPDDAKPYTFEDIAIELSEYGEPRSEKTLRSWRTKLVQEMVVLLFGIDGAISVESRDKPIGTNERGETDE